MAHGCLVKYTDDVYDAVIKARILDTDGVTQIDAYRSSLDPNTRSLSVTATITTIYAQTTITTTLRSPAPQRSYPPPASRRRRSRRSWSS